MGLLADFMEVDPVYERAAEEFLHDELEYVVVEDWEQAERGMGLLRDGYRGPRHVSGAQWERAFSLTAPDPAPELCRG